MNRVRIAALINFEANPFQQTVSYIHSTPILERKRRTHWDSGGGSYRASSRSDREPRFSNYSRRNRKLHSKQELLRNISSFAEHLFQSWKFDGFDEDYDPSASRSNAWFRQDFKGNGFRKGKSRNKEQQAWNKTGFQNFVDDDDFEVENIFKSAFGGNKYSYYSFINDEPPWGNSSGHSNNHRFNWNWERQDEEEDRSSSSSDSVESDLTSDRLALGLNSSGPLSLTDVKKAYRECALKWHPDRHHGPHKRRGIGMKPVAAVLNAKFLRTTNQKAVLFHSTPVLSSRRRSPSSHCASEGVYRVPQKRYKNFVRGFSNPLWKRILLRDPTAHSDGLVQNDYFYYTAYSSQSSSWFRQDYQATRSHAFRGSNFNNYWSSWNWGNQKEDKHDSSREPDYSKPEMTSERLALGLSTSGPLTLDEVKNAYRACAMKWHPDHNQGLFKPIAEEKFKSCTTAYKSLCDMLAPNDGVS